MASICNDEQGSFGVMSGHDRNTLSLAGHARLAEVTVGARNGTHAWLQAGPQTGTAVIVYPPASLADGARVKPRKV